MSDHLRYRGKLTSALARALTSYVARRPKMPIADVKVVFFNKSRESVASMSLANAVNAIAFDLTSDGRIHWSDAIDVEIE